jgi:hypothetical protein
MTSPREAKISASLDEKRRHGHDASDRASRKTSTAATLKVIDLHELHAAEDLVPQAILNVTVEELAMRHAATIAEGTDRLDSYRGIALEIDAMKFAIMHYAGHPVATSTLYLPRTIGDVDTVTTTISMILSALDVHLSSLAWQRKDDPDL